MLQRAILPPEAEDGIRATFFGKLSGFFVEVGANEPVTLSQTYSLEAAGWSGVLIEPLPEQAQQLRTHRRAQVFEYACSSPEMANRTVPFFVAGIYSSLNQNLPTVGVGAVAEIPVRTKTLDQILIEARAPKYLDFLSIDVEGAEIEVLEGFTFEKWRPQLLVVEDRALDLTLHHYIQKQGYRWIKRFALNNWYVPQNSGKRASMFGHLQFFRKYYLGMHLRRFKRALKQRSANA